MTSVIYSVIFFTLFWAICGIMTFGLTLGYYWGRYSSLSEGDGGWWSRQVDFALAGSVAGPVGLFVAFWLYDCGKYGFLFRLKQPQPPLCCLVSDLMCCECGLTKCKDCLKYSWGKLNGKIFCSKCGYKIITRGLNTEDYEIIFPASKDSIIK